MNLLMVYLFSFMAGVWMEKNNLFAFSFSSVMKENK